MPVNMSVSNISRAYRERIRGGGSSLADIDPMQLDSKVTFESVGGLDRHVSLLKEMLLFPLLYPDLFKQFGMTAPRGVLFHGPPGTGKTLMARALANECSKCGQPVAFFMRKGADCLSKWIGESERQLRLLFDQVGAAVLMTATMTTTRKVTMTKSIMAMTTSSLLLWLFLLSSLEKLSALVIVAMGRVFVVFVCAVRRHEHPW
jgi:hypothetical protein